MDNLIEWGIGVLFVSVYSFGRYNTPDSNRSSTTFDRFTTCYLLYTCGLLTFYWLFTVLAQVSPDIVQRLLQLAAGKPTGGAEGAGGWDNLKSPITTALIFTTFLPNVPGVKKIDRSFLQFFWDMGGIPSHAVKLANRLYRSTYLIHPVIRPQVIDYAGEKKINNSHLIFEENDTLFFLWVKMCALFCHIKNWEKGRNSKFPRFLKRRQAEFENMDVEFSNISDRFRNYCNSANRNSDRLMQNLREDTHNHLVDDCQVLLKRLCKFIAQAMLLVKMKAEARAEEITLVGFEFSDTKDDNITIPQLIYLWGLIMSIFFAASLVENFIKNGLIHTGSFGGILFLAFLMSINYGISAFAGIYPKTRWRFADIEVTNSRPVLGYIYSGVLAVIMSFLLMVALKFTKFSLMSGESYQASFNSLYVNLSWSYPYLLQSFVVGFIIAFVADNGIGQYKSITRVYDTLITAFAMLAVSFLVYCMMHGTFIFDGTKLPEYRETSMALFLFFLVKCTIIDASIGWLVPNWYRGNRFRTPSQWITRFIDRENVPLKVAAGRLNPGELKDALITGAAAITIADGRIDEIEKAVIRRCLNKMAEYEILEFSVDETMREFLVKVLEWRAENTDLDNLDMRSIRRLRGRKILAEFLLQLCLAVAHSDGIYEEFEKKMIDMIIDNLNYDLNDKSVVLGLRF